MIKLARACCGDEEISLIQEAFEYGYLGQAGKTFEFEEKIADYLGTNRYVMATNNGTSALHLALHALGIGVGDEVIVPAFTYIATVQAVLMVNATPVFCDIEYESMLIDCEDYERKITSKTKAVIPVHYAGRPCNLDRLTAISEKRGIRIVEDAAHAFGTAFKGKKIGAFGDIVCFSFDSIKVMTCGEGGAIVTADAQISETVKVSRMLGIDKSRANAIEHDTYERLYDVNSRGFRYHMSNINAAIGLAQIRKVDAFISYRRELCGYYNSRLSTIKKIKLWEGDYNLISPFIYVVRVLDGRRDELKKYLLEHGVETGISYIPCHQFGLFSSLNVELKVTEKVYGEILSLPLHCEISKSDIDEIVSLIHSFFGKCI